MKILALSDVHGDVGFMRQMAEKGAREHVDLVILAGDILQLEQWTDGLIKPFKEKGLEVAVLPGNHEGLADIQTIVEKYGAKNLHGYSMMLGDVGIFGCGYADISHHQLTDEEFLTTLRKAYEAIKHAKKKIMVTHVQPSESILGLGIFPGSSGVRQAIEELKPDIHICGHIHETHGIEDVIGRTKSINVGKTGRIIEI